MADQPAPAPALDRYLSYFLIFAFTSGTLAHCLPAVLPVTKLTTDGLLFVLNGLVLYAIYRTNQDKRLFIWLAVAYAFTFVMEALGVATGAIFGEYKYGPTMWFQWLGVPFVIALNWCVLTLACNEVAIRLLERFFPAASPPTPANRKSNIENRTSHISDTPASPTPANQISHIANRISHIFHAASFANQESRIKNQESRISDTPASASPIPPTTPPTSPLSRGEGPGERASPPANRISHIFHAASFANQKSRTENRESRISDTTASASPIPPTAPPTDYPLPTIYYLLLAAALTALYDVTIEPVAIALDYWQWGGGEIPLQNYLAWAIIAFLISLPLYVFKIRFRSPVLLVYFFAQLFFFLVLNFML